jgi:hypothetical protein
MMCGGTRTWAIGSLRIVGVLAVRNGIQLVPLGNLIVDAAEELLFAVEAPIRSIRLILRSITFVRRDFNERYAHLARDIMCRTPLLGRQTWRYSEERHDPLRPKGLCRQGK